MVKGTPHACSIENMMLIQDVAAYDGFGRIKSPYLHFTHSGTQIRFDLTCDGGSGPRQVAYVAKQGARNVMSQNLRAAHVSAGI